MGDDPDLGVASSRLVSAAGLTTLAGAAIDLLIVSRLSR